MQSELLPSAWPVDEPSKDQSGKSLGLPLVTGFWMTLVLERISLKTVPCGFVLGGCGGVFYFLLEAGEKVFLSGRGWGFSGLAFRSLSLFPLKREVGEKRKNKTADLLRGALESVEPDVLGALGQGADADDRGAAGLWCFRFRERGRGTGGEEGAEVVSDEVPGRLFERHELDRAAAGAIDLLFLSLFRGPNAHQSARAIRHWRAADGPLEREIGTGCIQGLKKCPETAALGNGKYKSTDWSLFFRSIELARERRGKQARGVQREHQR